MSKKKIALLLGIVVVAGVGAFALLAPKTEETVAEPQHTVETVLNTEAEEPTVEVEPTTEVEIPELITKTEEASPPSETAPIEEFKWVDEPCTGDRIEYVMVEDTVLRSEPREEGAEVYTVEAGTTFYFDAIAKTEDGGYLGYGLLVIDENTKGYFPEIAAEMYFRPTEQEVVAETTTPTEQAQEVTTPSDTKTEVADNTQPTDTTPSTPSDTPTQPTQPTQQPTQPTVDPLQELIDAGLIGSLNSIPNEGDGIGANRTQEDIDATIKLREELGITYQ